LRFLQALTDARHLLADQRFVKSDFRIQEIAGEFFQQCCATLVEDRRRSKTAVACTGPVRRAGLDCEMQRRVSLNVAQAAVHDSGIDGCRKIS